MQKKYFQFGKILILCGFFGFHTGTIFAAEEIPTKVLDYKEYKKNATAQCDSPNVPWGKDNSLLPVPQYGELKAEAVERQRQQLLNSSRPSEEEKNRLNDELDRIRIGNFSGFKTLEIARLQYRTTMDNLFSCAIVESRLHIINDVQTRINAAFPALRSEIQQQLEHEAERLQSHKNRMKCNPAKKSNTSFMKEMVNSASKQYCHYRHYLLYLEQNLQNNQHFIQEIEKKLGDGSGTIIPLTSQEWVKTHNRYASSLNREIQRADNSLPLAMKTYKEMEKAYPAHLMMIILYDDYIRLRKNLASYMNASTQLYMKAYNAQSSL